jgi:hypothetical protein
MRPSPAAPARLAPQRPTLGAVLAECRVRGEVAPASDAQFQAAAGDQVEHRGVLGHPDRQLQRQGHDPRPQADPRCLDGDLAQEDERRGKAAFVFVEMVLGDPGRIEATAFGVDDLRGGQPVPLGGVRLIEQPREEAQAFRQRRRRHPLNLALSGSWKLVSTKPPSTCRPLCITETVSEICRTKHGFESRWGHHPKSS